MGFIIGKFKLEIIPEQPIDIPICSKILSVKEQDGKLCLWALINTDLGTHQVTVYIKGTGHPADDIHDLSPDFIDTVVMSDGLVWHVFI